MKKEEVLELIGKENEVKFEKFIAGQTIGFEKGIPDFYEDDVEKFCRINKIEVKNK